MPVSPNKALIVATTLIAPWGPKLLTGLILFIAFWLASRWARRIIDGWGKNAELEQRAVFELASETASY
ncbi:MAG: hypothetical protein COB53_05920 [Elusimicrobia bacterium]|nr:MAG: hypothetical protein COB53_05920 [Elusimicrobiota bacterium]